MVKIRRFENMDAIPASELILASLQKLDKTPESAKDQLFQVYTPEGLIELSKKRQLYVAVEHSSLVLGTIGISENIITTLFVHPMHMNEGIGTMLLEHAENKIKNQSYSHIKSISSIEARPFFEKFGYRLVSDVLIDGKTVSYNMQKAF